MNTKLLIALGDELYAAFTERRAVEPLTNRHPELSIEQAYAIQQQLNARRLAAGARVVGSKIGVTSEAVMKLLDVRQPDFGLLTDTMRHPDGGEVSMSGLIQPKIEAEIAFRLLRDLKGPGVTSDEVLAATHCVMVAFEIVDSRIRDWRIKIQDTVADNASCGAFVLGHTEVDPRTIDLLNCPMVMEKNGAVVATGKGAATLGSPLNAVVWLANTFGALGQPLRAGEIVLSGALGAMVPVAAGDRFHARIGGIGDCSIRFV